MHLDSLMPTSVLLHLLSLPPRSLQRGRQGQYLWVCRAKDTQVLEKSQRKREETEFPLAEMKEEYWLTWFERVSYIKWRIIDFKTPIIKEVFLAFIASHKPPRYRSKSAPAIAANSNVIKSEWSCRKRWRCWNKR